MESLNSIIFFIIFQIIIINQFVLHLPVAAKSVLRPGEELNSTSTLVSADGNFTLGFFTIPVAVNLTYLGISYTGNNPYNNIFSGLGTKIIWIANRDIPMKSFDIEIVGSLIIDDTGTLKVVRGVKNNTLFNVSIQGVGSGINTKAVLEDSGNFVLYDEANGNQTLWQSFDHPTNSLLPGMKLGYNRTTRQNWTLTSWLRDDYVPASGDFTMSLEQFQNSLQLLIYRRGEVYWSWFTDELSLSGIQPKIISDASGMFFTYTSTEPNMLQLSSEGEIRDYTSTILIHTCDGYESKDGCGLLPIYPTEKEKAKTLIWVLCVAIVLTLLLAAALMCYLKIRKGRREERMKNDYINQLTGSHSFNYGDELEKGIKDAPDVKIFSFKAILAATYNFSDKNKLGQGGYGPVYKGNLLDGRQIAVKRLSKTSGQGIEEFKSELILISKLQHTNLVRLYGCCIHQEEKMLIYEFMPNKSLDFFLFAEDKKETMDWRIRFNIIEGVAQGLLYLHKYSRMRVIHRDLKVSNVLLDENMNPKIADFGMARIFQQNVTEAITHRVVGTYGYMAPEYAMEGNFSIKSDVFSFGVLILEIISGKRNTSFYNLDRPLNLVGYAWELWKGDDSLELKDRALGESCDVKQLLRTIHAGLLCVQENADDRPTMSQIISMLNNEITDLPNPKQPAFFTGRQVVQIERKSNNPVSVNGLTHNNGSQIVLANIYANENFS